MKYVLSALRPRQWVKNLFIFLPLMFSRQLFVFPENAHTAIAFGLFCLAAGAAYLINDILDRKSDRNHPTKNLRPIASGKVSVLQASLVALVLGAAAIAPAFALDIRLGALVAGYLVFNLLYSTILKHVVIVDVFCIGGFFLLRILAGAVTSDLTPSHWILIMTVLLALFLGFNKRRQELKLTQQDPEHRRPTLSKYDPYFIDQMVAVITSSIVIAYMLYTVDDATVARFGSRHLLLSVPFVYYGIFRYLYQVHKVRSDGDPTRVLFSDRMIQLDILAWAAVCAGVIYGKI